jgi:hypothetical protein
MAFNRSTNFAFSQVAFGFSSGIAPVQVGDRVGVKLNINGTEQDIVLIAIEAATANAPGFVVKITGGAYLTDLQIRDNFVTAISGTLFPPFPERDKLAFNKLTFSGGVPGVQIKYTGNIYAVVESLVTDSFGVLSFGASYDFDSGVNGFRTDQLNDKATTFVIKQNVKGGFTPFRNDANTGAPSFGRDTAGDITTDFLPPFLRYSPANYQTSKRINTYDFKNKPKVLLSPPFDSQYLPNIPVPSLQSVSITKLNATQYEVEANVTWNTAAIVNDVSNVYYPELLFDFDGEGDWQPSAKFIVPAGSYTISVRDEVGFETSIAFDVTEAAAEKPEPFFAVPVTNPLRFIDQAPQRFKRSDNTLYNEYSIRNVFPRFFRQPMELGQLIRTQFRSNYDNHIVKVYDCQGVEVDSILPVLKIENLNLKDWRDCRLKAAGDDYVNILFRGGNIYDLQTGAISDTYEQVGGKLPAFAREGMQVELSSSPQAAETNIKVLAPLILDDFLTITIGATTYRFICGYEDDPAYPEYEGYDGYFIPGALVSYVYQVINSKVTLFHPNYAATLDGDTVTISASATGTAYTTRVIANSGNFEESDWLAGIDNDINGVFKVEAVLYDETEKAWVCQIPFFWDEGAINAKCLSSYNLETYNIWEFDYLPAMKGQFTFELTGDDADPRYNDQLWKSEPILVDQFDNCVTIEYSSDENRSEIDYRTGISFAIYAPGRFDRFNPSSEDESTMNDDGDIKLLKSIYSRVITLEVNPIPEWLIEKLMTATGQSNVDIQGLSATRKDQPEIESLMEQNNPLYTMTCDFNVNKNISVTQSAGIVSESVAVLGATEETVIGV